MRSLLLAIATTLTIALPLSSCDILHPEEPGLLVPKTVDEDPTLPSIFVNGTQLHAETFGNPDNPMLVVLHGGPGGDYRSMLKCQAFADDGYYVVFYDQRGSGLSKRYPKEAYSRIEMYTDDLDSVIAHYRRSPGQKLFLMGQSWGAMLATAYVNLHPEAVAGVVLSEPGGFTWKDTKDFVSREYDMNMFGENVSDYLFLDQIITGSDHVKLDFRAAQRGAAGSAPGNPTGAGPVPMWRFGAVCNAASLKYADEQGFDFTTHLAQYTRPVLFLYSELDKVYGKEHAEHVSSAYPNVQLVEVKGTGHEIPYAGWEKFHALSTTYLNSLR